MRLNSMPLCLATAIMYSFQCFGDNSNDTPCGTYTSDLFPMALCQGKKIEEASIDQLQSYLSNGDITSQQLAICYIQRIWQTDDYINAVLELNPDFLEIAAALDAER
ncbi:unnamed protein product [Zymoseptoria tritici ST99CH_1A5]|uniref:LysM domain-containing protein n=3 Tax=Zymoseptoria tritici TaxID=1047171 RepID=A0A1X7RKN5_ZYMT9|nr:unnamed protein product [Zymoseptoria tritici ST99CH_3D7]SMR46524.1 unnamed protein product [Zymoseptoria tritici ST99CH_1E4]SMR47767.1 unnamed protein product [Zymoseptoria tritici ST99CH_3D1]SMY21670.1 unnamed protein product [Zymoseptoria tritici ST99CH_1A5]